MASKFVDPLGIGSGVEPNPYFPLVPGTRWTYQGGDETIIVTVTEETKLIGGVTCLTVNDVVMEDGQPLEDTDDWYAQDKDGNVWYCGEVSLNYESPDGEDEAEILSLTANEAAPEAGIACAGACLMTMATRRSSPAFSSTSSMPPVSASSSR